MIEDVNEPPTVTLDIAIDSLPENTDTASRIKVADIVVVDDALGTNLLSLSGPDANSFELDGSELFLIAGTSLDYETQSSLQVTVLVDDVTVGSTPDDSTILTLAIIDVNEPTVAPVVPPTDAPIVPPTNAPVVPPSDAPVIPPTNAPVVSPTDSPAEPSDAPVSPIVPSIAPVVHAPVVAPTDSPFDTPSSKPRPKPRTRCPSRRPKGFGKRGNFGKRNNRRRLWDSYGS